MEHPNAELYRRLTAAFQSGDIDTVKNALAPGVRWHEAGNPEVLGRGGPPSDERCDQADRWKHRRP